MIDRPGAGRRASVSRFALAFACTFFCAAGALAQSLLPPQGRPVTARDIIGKTICWENGHWGLYAADGGFSNNRHGPRRHKWSAPEPGVIQTGDHDRQAVVLPDGGFVSFVFKYRARKKPGGPMVEHWGKVCG
jgi:hypothetical protein